MHDEGEPPALVGGRGGDGITHLPCFDFPPPASLLLYHLTLRSDLKSAIIIDGLEQAH